MLLKLLVFSVAVGLSSATLPAGYVAMTAAQKQDVLWNNLVAETYTQSPMPRSDAPDGPLYNVTFLTLAFGQEDDELAPGRPKIVGTNGVTAKGEFIVYPNSPYTGIFKGGQDNIGIIRLSSNTGTNLEIFFAMKVLVDYNTSQNLHMIHDVDGFGVNTTNLFTWPLQSQIPKPLQVDYDAGRYSSKVDVSFDGCIKALPGGPLHRPPNAWGMGCVEQSACDNKNNVLTSGIIAPYIIQVTPQVVVTVQVFQDDWRSVVMAKVPANTKLYTVQASKSPCDPFVDIGEVWTRTDFIASGYGDHTLRFGQPYEKWDYSVAAPGVYCTKDPDALPTWDNATITTMLDLATGINPPSNNYANSPTAISGTAAGVPSAKVKVAGLKV